MATTERFKSGDEMRERTIWWRVTVWGKQAESVNQYLNKGRLVLVDARMNPDPETGGPRVYTRNDGTAGASYEVTAINVRFLGGRGTGASEGQDVPPEADTEGEDIPF